MDGPIQTAKRRFTASGIDHAWIGRAGDDLVHVQVGESLVRGLPTVATVVADEHAAHFDAGIEACRRDWIVSAITRSRLRLGARGKISARTVFAHAFQLFPAAVFAAVNRRWNSAHHHAAV